MKTKIICGFGAVLILGVIALPFLLSLGEEESFAVDASSREKVVDVRFLNTQTNIALGTDAEGNAIMHNSDEANLIKTKDGKYVLIDTAINGSAQASIIYNALKDYQNTTKVVIDYLVISHMHADHYGNAVDIINSNKFDVKNLVIKYGKSSVTKYDDIIRAARNKGVTIYTNATTREVDGIEVQKSAKYKKMDTEGTGNAAISVGNYLKLYFYNTTNVYDTCVKGYHLNWYLATKDSESFTKTSGGKYLRFDNTSGGYPNISYTFTNNLESAGVGGYNEYFYAGFRGEKSGEYDQASSCNDNANSYGVLAEIKAGSQNKYIYFANDLDNSGYDIKPTTTSVTYYSTQQGKNVTKKIAVYGQGRGVLYAKPDLNLVKNGTVVSRNAAYSESKVALEIADKLGDDLSNLVIYQQSHHGIDNAPDALATLKINRADVYAVANRRNTFTNGYTKYSFDYQRANYYLSSTKKKMFTGYKSGEGVYCAIDNVGDYKCSYSEIGVGKLQYNMNGGSGSASTQTCLHDGSCSLKVSTVTPTRSGYKFLGWATTNNAKSAAYTANKSIAVSSNTTLYAVWAPNRTLSYDMNGGSDSISAQTCNPTTTNGSCTVKVSTVIPTRSGYKFLGWAESASATKATYEANSTVTLANNKTIYAVWQRVININTSVDGGNGTITPSMTNVQKGKTVTIVFSPRSGYEIDNVKVNDSEAAVTDNRLTVTAGDEDINIVVKYKLSPSVDPDPPLPPAIITQIFHMYFGAASGESGIPGTQSCTATGVPGDALECSITIPETVPTRENYVFLGYGLTTDRNTVVYHPGEAYTINDDVYLVSVWAPVYTLSYDTNGGAGEVSSQTCNPTEKADDGCNVVISTDRPTMADHEFFGWATDPAAEVPEYLPGDTFTFSAGIEDVTLYAIWADGGVEWVQNQNYAKGSGSDLIVEIEYPMENFVSLTVDDSVVDPTSYTVTPGSTIIALGSEYADTLGSGGHTLQANYNNGVTVVTTFAISEEGEEGEMSDEGDDEDYNDVEDDEMNTEGDAEDQGGRLAVPNTGGRNGGGINGGNSVVLYVIGAGIIMTIVLGRKIIKRVRQKNKFGI